MQANGCETANEWQLASDVMNALDLRIIVFDKNRKAVICNRAFTQARKWSSADVRGMHVTEVFIQNIAVFMQSAMDTALERVKQAENTVTCAKSGRHVAWTVTILPGTDGDIYYLCSGRELPEREQSQYELEKILVEAFDYEREVCAFRESAEAVIKYNQFSDAAGEILNACKKLLGATCGYVALLNNHRAGHDVINLDTGGFTCKVQPQMPVPVRGLRDKAYRTGLPVYCNTFGGISHLPPGHIPLENILFIPLKITEKTIGLLALGNKPGGFSEHDIQLAPAFGEFVAIAVNNGIYSEKLKDSEKRFRSVAQTAGNAIVTLNSRGEVIFWNYEAEKIFGYSEEEVLWQPFTCLISNEFHRTYQKKFQRFLTRPWREGSKPVFQVIGLKKDRTKIPIEVSLAVWETSEGVFFTGVIRDITESKRMKQELSEALEQYRSLVELSPDGIVVHNSDGVIVYANSAAAKLVHVKDAEELIGKQAFDFVHPDFRAATMERMRRIIIDGLPAPPVDEKFLCADGTIIDVEATGTSYLHKGKRANLVIVRDITDRKKMDEEAAKATKLEAIGILAGGIAHDFNNILTVILGNISLAKLYAEPDSKVVLKLKDIESATLQTKDLTQQLLTFAKGGVPIKKTACIKDLLTEITTFALSGTSVLCGFTLEECLWSVEMDTGQIGQVINNLVINAVQAMPEGGKIYVGAENITIPEKESELLSLLPGNYVRLTVSDEGTGIPADILPKIFLPFFTTKEQGNGLGLATCYAIVRNHDGLIGVDSEEGRGTKFYVYLPASSKDAVNSRDDAMLTPGSGRILLMDDDEGVRKVAGEMLEYLGYEVEYAKNGEEVIERFVACKESGTPFSLVIMDVTIRGGMGGKNAMRRLLEIDPQAIAVVSSGYANSPVMAGYEQYGFKGYVAKPYKTEELSVMLNKVLAPG